MTKLKVKRGDTVVVTTGKDAGKQGKILMAYPKENKIVVEGVAVAIKARKPRSAQDKGGLTKINQKIDASNVMMICPTCKKASRIGYKQEGDVKIRMCKKCGKALGNAKLEPKASAKSSKAEPAKAGKEAKEPAKKPAKK